MSATDVACPTCNSPVGKKCRTVVSRRVTDTHQTRHDLSARHAARQQERDRLLTFPDHRRTSDRKPT